MMKNKPLFRAPGVLLILALGFTNSLWAASDNTFRDADWEIRSKGSGVLMATRFDTEAEVTDWIHLNKRADHVSWSQQNVASGNGALRFDILKTDRADAGNWRRWLSDDHRQFDEGDEFFVQFRQFVPAYLATHKFKGGGGWKQMIISRHSSDMAPGPAGSNQLNEIVLQNTYHRSLVQGYNRNLNKRYPPWEVAAKTACSKQDFIYQNAIDRNTSSRNCLLARQRFGGLRSFYAKKMHGYKPGHPDPETGAFIYYPDEWLTFLLRVKIGTYGESNHEIQVWAARETDTGYTMLFDFKDRQLGRGPLHNTLWLLPYNTNRKADPEREDTYTLYDEVIVATKFIPAPQPTPDRDASFSIPDRP